MKFNSRTWLVIAALVVLVVAGGIYWAVSRQNTVSIADSAAAPAVASNDLMVAGPLGEASLGSASAPNTVIEYASMTCPHCGRFHNEVYPLFKTKYIDTGKVRFIFREYPLDPLATAGSVIARCAPPERYFPLVDLMFDHQADWAFVPDPVVALQSLVKQAGISEATFTECLKNQSILDGVNWVHDRGEKQFGVNSTPTFFINGVKFTGEQTLDSLDKALGG